MQNTELRKHGTPCHHPRLLLRIAPSNDVLVSMEIFIVRSYSN